MVKRESSPDESIEWLNLDAVLVKFVRHRGLQLQPILAKALQDFELQYLQG
jgi:hypothetical protein